MSYTRVEYIGSVPQSKIRIFETGHPNLEYEYEVSLISDSNNEISSAALESMRLHINRNLNRKLEKSKFYFKIPIYPHEVIRTHGWLGFAGADRISSGMQLAFGKPKKRAAAVNEGQVLVFVQVNEKQDVEIVKRILEGGAKKLPVKGKVLVEKLSKKEANDKDG